MAVPAIAACLLCQSEKTVTRWRISIPDMGERVVEGCPDCGFLFVVPRPSLAELERFYSDEYFESKTCGRGFTDYLPKSYTHIGEGWLVGRRLRREKPSGRVLDVGCGSGDFLRGVQETSRWQAFGTDISSYAVDMARKHSGAEVFCGELAAAAFPSEYFDAVFLRNVLEHVPEPVALLHEVRRILRAGGLLRLVVPNGYTEIAPFAAANRRNAVGGNAQAHLNFFTPRCFRRWLLSCGFEVKQIYTLGLKRGLFELGFLPQAWKVSRRGGFSRRPSAPSSPPRWKQTLTYAYLRRLLKSSVHLPVWLPLGQELHAVLRRPVR